MWGLLLGRERKRASIPLRAIPADACKIKSYDLNYQCIKGYGLMNW